ncbi:MAG TPA: fibronectin type III domain-containing protein [Pyrinomonadaceae bacterium]|nr:fibronectin type III domain-containing protein [Pyrinomonadaceae bacterium]
MPKVKLNFRGLSIRAKIAKGRQVIGSITGNPNFPNPHPALADVTALINAAESKASEVDATTQLRKTQTTELGALEDQLDAVMAQLASYVDSVSAGDEAKIQSAGLDTRAAASTTTEPPAVPSALDVTVGDRDGELDASWDTVAGAKSYIIELSEDQPNAWRHSGVSTKSKYTLSGLVSGKRYWIRVAAINSVGQSGWSDPATKIAP